MYSRFANIGTVIPEDINSTPSGAPSKRLAAIKPDYNKVLEGNLIAMEIGINGDNEKRMLGKIKGLPLHSWKGKV